MQPHVHHGGQCGKSKSIQRNETEAFTSMEKIFKDLSDGGIDVPSNV